MSEQAYEITALAMRYWFAALMVIAVICAWRLNRVQLRTQRLARRSAPNGEFVGELLVIKGSGSVERGERYPLQRDIVIGRRRSCDVILRDRGVHARHARAELRSGGMYIAAIGRAPISMRGQPLKSEILVRDGALFCIGDITLQLTLYDVTADYYPDEEARTISAVDVHGDPYDADYADDYVAEEYDELPEYDPDYDADYDPGETKGSLFGGIFGGGQSSKRNAFSPITYDDDAEDDDAQAETPDAQKRSRKKRW